MKKRQRNPEMTRQKLLAAATIEFSDKGLKGARISGIARRAGTNYQAIYHHFGSKEKIYAAVLETLYTNDWLEHAYPELKARAPAAAVEFFMSAMVERFRKEVHYAALFSDENLHKGQHIKHMPSARAFFHRVVAALTEVLDRGVRQGVFRRGVDARLLYILISTEIGAYFVNSATRSAVFDVNMGSPQAVDQWITHLKALIVRGLRAD